MGTLIPTKRVNTYTEILFDPNGVIDSTIGDKAINLIDGSVYEHRGNKVWEKLSELPSDVNFTRSRKAKGFRYIDEALQFGGFLKDEIIEIAAYHKESLYGGGKFIVHSTPLQSDCCAYDNPITSDNFASGELTDNDFISLTMYVPEPKGVKQSLVILNGAVTDQEIELLYFDGYWQLKSGSGNIQVTSVLDSHGNELNTGGVKMVFNYREEYTVKIQPVSGNTEAISNIQISACVPISSTYNFTNTVSGTVNFIKVGDGSVMTSNQGLDFYPVGGDGGLLWKPDTLTPNGFDVFSNGDTSIIRIIENNTVTPQMFGAVTSTFKRQFGYDCADAIQGAFDSDYNVYIPAGYYYISHEIILRKPKQVNCEGGYAQEYAPSEVYKQITVFYSDRNIDFLTFKSKDIIWNSGVVDTTSVSKTADGLEDFVGHTKCGIKINIDGGIWDMYVNNIQVFGSREKLLHSGIGTIGIKINCDEPLDHESQTYLSQCFFTGGRIEGCSIAILNPEKGVENNGYVTQATFTGTGLDDLISGGGSAESSDYIYIVEIDGVGGTDTFRWKRYKRGEDIPSAWNASGVIISGDTQSLNTNGAEIKFQSTTGHTVGDSWEFIERTKRFIWGNNVFFDLPLRACKQYIVHKGISAINHRFFIQDIGVVPEEEFKAKTYAIESTNTLFLDTRVGDYIEKQEENEEGVYRHENAYYKILGAGGLNKDFKFLESDWRKSVMFDAYKNAMIPIEDFTRIYDNRNAYFLNTFGGSFFSQTHNQLASIGDLPDRVTWKGYLLPRPTYLSDGSAASVVRYADDYITGTFLQPLNDLGESPTIGTWESDANTTVSAESRITTGDDPYPDNGENFLRVTADIDYTDTYARYPISVVEGEVYNISFALRASSNIISGRIVLEGFDEEFDSPFSSEKWRLYEFDRLVATITGTAYIYIYPSKTSEYSVIESLKANEWRYSPDIDGHETAKYFTANNPDFSLITEFTFNQTNASNYDKTNMFMVDFVEQINNTNDLTIEVALDTNDGTFGLYNVSSVTENDHGEGNYSYTLSVSLVDTLSNGSLASGTSQHTAYSLYVNPEEGNDSFILSNAMRHGNYLFKIFANGYNPIISQVLDSPASNAEDGNYDLVQAVIANLTPQDPDITISTNGRYGRFNIDTYPTRFKTILRTSAATLGKSGDYIDVDSLKIEKTWYENNPFEASDINNSHPLLESSSEPTLVQAGAFEVGRMYVITDTGTTDFTLIGASDSNVGTYFTATGIGTGTGTATTLQGCFINNDGLLKSGFEFGRNVNYYTPKSYYGMSEIKIIPRNPQHYCKRLFLSSVGNNFEKIQVVVVSNGTEFSFTYAPDYRAPMIPTPGLSPIDYILIRHIGIGDRGASLETRCQMYDIALEQEEYSYSPFLRSVGGTIEQDLAVNGTLSIAGADTNLKNLIPQADTNPTTISELITLLKSTGIIY